MTSNIGDPMWRRDRVRNPTPICCIINTETMVMTTNSFCVVI